MCIAHRDTISGPFLCHRNSDLTRLMGKAYLSVDFFYLLNVLKVFSIQCFSEENITYSVGCFVINRIHVYFCHLQLLFCRTPHSVSVYKAIACLL